MKKFTGTRAYLMHSKSRDYLYKQKITKTNTVIASSNLPLPPCLLQPPSSPQSICVDHFALFLCLYRFQVLPHQHWLQDTWAWKQMIIYALMLYNQYTYMYRTVHFIFHTLVQHITASPLKAWCSRKYNVHVALLSLSGLLIGCD